MKYIKTLILTAGLAAGLTHAAPPVFSQKNSCCWIASWVQLFYNCKPLIDKFLSSDRAAYTDFEVFKKTAIGKQLATETREIVVFNPVIDENELVTIPALDACKIFFTPAPIATMDAYRELFIAMRNTPNNTAALDDKLIGLQKLLQKEAFGKYFSNEMVVKESQFFNHPFFYHFLDAFSAQVTSKSLTIFDGIKQQRNFKVFGAYTELGPIFYIRNVWPDLGLNLRDSFTIDMTPLVTEQFKNSGQCLKYDLIGIGTEYPGHFWVFIKDQYDPAEPWWRCDTLSGNRRANEQEIITECAQYTPVHLIYKRSTCGKKTDEVKQTESEPDNESLGKLVQVLWEMGK